MLQTSSNVNDLSHISSVIMAENGEKGYNKSCFGKNAEHTIIHVPVGTMIRNMKGSIIADLNQEGMMFIAARGGAGGHGNSFFKSDVQQSPRISEYGAVGEDLQYVLEISSMAHVGLVSKNYINMLIRYFNYKYNNSISKFKKLTIIFVLFRLDFQM